MKKLLEKILNEIKPLELSSCGCPQCSSARELVPLIKTELAKFGTDELVDLRILIADHAHRPGVPQTRDEERKLETLNKVIQAIS